MITASVMKGLNRQMLAVIAVLIKKFLLTSHTFVNFSTSNDTFYNTAIRLRKKVTKFPEYPKLEHPSCKKLPKTKPFSKIRLICTMSKLKQTNENGDISRSISEKFK